MNGSTRLAGALDRLRSLTRVQLVALAGGLLLTLLMAGFFAIPILKEFALLGGSSYTAELATASGIGPGDQVRVAGVKVGRVTGVKLAGDRVRMAFRIDDGVVLGRATEVEVKLGSIFGQRVVEIHPLGGGRLPAGYVFPLEKTAVPFTIQDLATAAAQQLGGIDVKLMNKTVNALITSLRDTPEPAARLLANVTKLSVLLQDKFDEVDRILTQSNQLSATVAGQRKVLTDLIGQGDALLKVIKVRREAIHAVIVEVEDVAQRFEKLAVELDASAEEALRSLITVAEVMRKNEKALDEIYTRFPAVTRYLANVTGDGPWGTMWSSRWIPDNFTCAVPGYERQC